MKAVETFIEFQKYVKSIRLRPETSGGALKKMFQKYVKSIRLRPKKAYLDFYHSFQKYVKSIRLRTVLSLVRMNRCFRRILN